MKYIKKVILENFQSHKYSVIDFNEDLNVIVGPSDSGKSAIIRGIKWALYNEPSGDYFIREGAGECSVTIEFNDNVILKRYRSKYKNIYILTDRDGNEIKFEGFGSNVPQEIIETVGIKKINLDSDSSNAINLGEQLEGAFLLSEKTSVRASAIGRLVGVNIIDDALRDTLKDTRNLNINKKNIEDSVQSLELEIKKFAFLEELKLKLKNLENIKSKLSFLENKVEILNKLRDNLYEIQTEKENQSLILIKLSTIDNLSDVINSTENKIFRYRSLNNYNNNLINIKGRIDENDYIIKSLQSINLVNNKIYKLEVLCNSEKNYRKFFKKYNEIIDEKAVLIYTNRKLKNLNEIDSKLSEMSSKYIRLKDLNLKKVNYDNIEKNILIGSKYLERFKDMEKCSNSIIILDEKTNLLINYMKEYNKLLINSDETRKESKVLKDINSSIDKNLFKYRELLRRVEICPFCLSNIDDDKIEHIMNHYIGG
jgi:DNA repair exonuclease SbcCD ATPase subunit